MDKGIARIQILSSILAFPVLGEKHWTSDFGSPIPQKGDLVSINCCSPSKWYVSWVVDYDPGEGMPKYLLESIEDGECMWWSNVGISIYDRERVADNPNWRWTDQQFKFQSRWYRSLKKHKPFIVLPRPPIFLDNDGVILNVRIRYGLSDFEYQEAFPSWKKLTMKTMEAYYLEACFKYNQQKATQ